MGVHLANQGSLDNGHRSVVFRPAPVAGTRTILGVLLAVTLMVGVGVPAVIRLVSGTMSWWRLLLHVAVAVVPYALVASAMRRFRYEVGPNGITVRHFLSKSYGWDEIDGVGLWQQKLQGLVRFGVGASAAGLNLGRFRERRLGLVQVYTTTTVPPLILLHTRSLPVLLSPHDVGGFLEAVQRFSERPTIVKHE